MNYFHVAACERDSLACRQAAEAGGKCGRARAGQSGREQGPEGINK